jgi:multidrug efflux pump
MILSDVSVKRPVFAAVISLLLIVFGLVSFGRLPLREYPDIDPPVVTIETLYPGASANVVETRITELIEERIAGVEGIRFIASTSEDGLSTVTVEFDTGRDVDGAVNDVRDRVSAILGDLPDEADPPEIQKVDSNNDVIMWLNLVSDRMTVPALTDYADRYLVDRFSVLDGVARVRIGGGQNYAMRIWIDRRAMAARGLVVGDVEDALRAENLELPAGSIESQERSFTVRVKRAFRTAQDFSRLVLARGTDGYLVRLGDIARVERGTEEDRTFFRGNGVTMVGMGIIKQSTANTIDVARGAKAEMRRLNPTLPEGMEIKQSYDTSVFVEGAIKEVYKTLLIAIGLVILVIYLFLGSVRATIVPAVTVPVSIIASFIVLKCLVSPSICSHCWHWSWPSAWWWTMPSWFWKISTGAWRKKANPPGGGLQRHPPGRFRGHRHFPGAGRGVCAHRLSAGGCGPPVFRVCHHHGGGGLLFQHCGPEPLSHAGIQNPQTQNRPLVAGAPAATAFSGPCASRYRRLLGRTMKRPLMVVGLLPLLIGATVWLFGQIPTEYAPKEDRGAFFVIVNGPEGASYAYMEAYMNEIERRLMPFVESQEATRLLVRAPRTFSNYENFNTGIVIFVLNDWDQRRSAWAVMGDVRAKLAGLPGVRAFPVMRQGFGASIQKPLQFVIGGGTYRELAQWRDTLLEKIAADNPGLVGSTGITRKPNPNCRSTSTMIARPNWGSPSAISAAPWRRCWAPGG